MLVFARRFWLRADAGESNQPMAFLHFNRTLHKVRRKRTTEATVYHHILHLVD